MILFIAVIIAIVVFNIVKKKKYQELEAEILKKLGFKSWNVVSYWDDEVVVKSRQALEKYDEVKFFKENREKLSYAEAIIKKKRIVRKKKKKFLESNEYKSRWQYKKVAKQIGIVFRRADGYRICVNYITSAGNKLGTKEICLNQYDIMRFKQDPSLLMGKSEYNKYLREQQKEALSQKHRDYYDRVNDIIDYANKSRDELVIKGSQGQLDSLISQLFDKTVNTIKKIKSIDSEEWEIIGSLIERIKGQITTIVANNQRILDYYQSDDFIKIKQTCEALMSSQRDFNEYIKGKVQSISLLFGTRVVRNETVNDDEYNYVRQYKKTITPFTAEVSAQVFASAENNPLEYVVKYFYPNKKSYPEQIKKLYHLVEELETLRDAKQIIENYKKEYQQYLGDVPRFIMQNDESGFYSRLGFADISEDVLTVEYKFSYTSGGGLAQRSFTVPMTEDTIAELIKTLESKLTASAFAKEQRNLMTKKLREYIKTRDHFSCCHPGNSTQNEPNLLLEIDHIIPVSKGGCTVESNLQTLCWRCNRSKSDKIMA